MWLIIGCWFQSDETLDVEGDRVMVKPVMRRALFYGILHPEPELCGNLFHPACELFTYPAEGWIDDPSGHSYLFDICVTPGSITFTKVYECRRDTIRYMFLRRIGGIWVGEYTSDKCGTGTTWASITPIEPQFFEPGSFTLLVDKPVLHEWPHHPMEESGEEL